MGDHIISVTQKRLLDFMVDVTSFLMGHSKLDAEKEVSFRFWSLMELMGLWRQDNLTEEQRAWSEKEIEKILQGVEIRFVFR